MVKRRCQPGKMLQLFRAEPRKVPSQSCPVEERPRTTGTFLSSLSQACVPWAGGGLPGAATAHCWGRSSPQETRREPVTHFRHLGAPVGPFLLIRAAGSKDPPCGSVPSHYGTRLNSTGRLHPNKSLCNKRSE